MNVSLPLVRMGEHVLMIITATRVFVSQLPDLAVLRGQITTHVLVWMSTVEIIVKLLQKVIRFYLL